MPRARGVCNMGTMEVQEPYHRRPIRFLELWEESGWRVKVYGISYQRGRPRAELLNAAKAVAARRLREFSGPQRTYGVGFLGVHDGRDASFVFLDWWADENELHHHVYISPPNHPEKLEYVTPSGLAGCVWDLKVIGFERQAWIDAVLANPTGPDLEAYLRHRLNEDI